jgi:guanylate kinase
MAMMDTVQRRGVMLVLSSPSGAGKTTLSKRLLAAEPEVVMSVSVTTRSPRPGEVDGKDYHFITPADFERRAKAGDLLEWAEVFDHGYGTPRAPVEAALAAGRDVLFDIDWQGTRQLRERAGADLASIFILPPSAVALERRLIARGTDSSEVIASRMAKAGNEVAHWYEYDYVIVNDDLDASERTIRAVLTAERTRRVRNLAKLGALVTRLGQELG